MVPSFGGEFHSSAHNVHDVHNTVPSGHTIQQEFRVDESKVSLVPFIYF